LEHNGSLKNEGKIYLCQQAKSQNNFRNLNKKIKQI
jgi:hypothetical protein